MNLYYLAVFNLVLYSLLYFVNKDKLHLLFIEVYALGFLGFVGVFGYLPLPMRGAFIFDLIYILIILLLIFFTIKGGLKKLERKHFTWHPVIISIVFVGNYYIAIIIDGMQYHWLAGYLLAMLSQLIGFIVYKTKKVRT